MKSRAQRKKERRAKRRKEKKKERARRQESRRGPEILVGGNARHRQRLSEQIPVVWSGERIEDVAVFDDRALSTLTPELAQQVAAVREALRDALESRGDDALERMSVVARSSPLSEWRLFVRGLVDWLADNAEAASDAWKRLDPERRPGRIAIAMMAALRSDLEQISPFQGQQGQDQPPDLSDTPEWNRLDAQQLYHAKLLRRVRIDRAALRVADAGLRAREESTELLLGPRKMQWLRRFIEEYGDTEPDLAAALAQTALRRAFAQNFSDIFDEAARSFSGPRHDPRNRLLAFFYYTRFEDPPSARIRGERALGEYLNRDLPHNEALSAPLRGAIASQIHLNQARVLIQPERGSELIDLFFATPPDPKVIRMHLGAAVKADPANGPAYETHVDWIESTLDEDRLTSAQRTSLEKELAEVMRSWSQGVPEAVEPRLWLVDFYLENEHLDDARPHVEFLAASRQENPRVRAMPWKWQLLEAMRLCRRKAWLAEVPARLDEAERLWPAWLPKQWLPYLRAAWTLRTGQTEAFEQQRRQICQEPALARDSLADACLMLAAAQRMRATATELKPIREPVERAVSCINRLTAEELIETGSFFWDLHRAQLVYPAYRMHGKTIGKALCARLAKTPKLVLDGINDERVHKAVLWGSEYRFWPNGYEARLLPFFSNRTIERHPMFIAARLNAFLNERYRWGAERYRELGPLLRDAAQRERDAYYRHWFIELADLLDDELDSESSRSSRLPFQNLFGFVGDDDAEDDGLGFDPECDCPRCRAAKRRAQERASSSQAAWD
jgi:hypothetical protein